MGLSVQPRVEGNAPPLLAGRDSGNGGALPSMSFADAAARVALRLALRNWLRMLERSAVPLFGTALAGCVIWRLLGIRDHGWWVFLPGGLWLGATAFHAWLRRPAPFDAMAAWDLSAGQREMFASAWSFEQQAATASGAVLHRARAQAALTQRLPLLTRDLPVRLAHRAWVAPLVLAMFAFSGLLLAPVATEDRALSADARLRAGAAGKELAERVKIVEPLKSLSEEEKTRLKNLRVELEAGAKKLETLKTPRELLEDLERRARQTEKLAESLRSEDFGSLSAGLLSELERNADTADLGNALRGANLGAAAEEARLLEARLGQRKPTLEEEKRLEEALKRALEAANKKDRESTLGRHLEQALKELSAGNAAGAARQFGSLSGQLGQTLQRQQAQQQLRNLAQSIRGAGQQILGGQNLQRLMPQAPSGTQALTQQPVPGSGTPGSSQGMLAVPGAGRGAPTVQIPLPIPGAGSSAGAPSFPIPGTGNSPSMGLPMPGAGAGGFPIPGFGGMPGGAAMAGAAGSQGNDGGTGGSEAGSGTAALGAAPTKPLAANQTGVVAPAPGSEGPSEVTAVDGESHREAAARTPRQIAVEFLKAEETALAEEPLPLSRREEVLRYFTAVRQQLEHQP